MELLIVFAIIVVLTGIIFTNQNSFNKTIILANTSYDVALSLRSAETYGLGGNAIENQPIGYGLHFDRNTPTSFLLFADTYPPLPIISPCHSATENDPFALDAQSGDCSYESTGSPGTSDVLTTRYAIGNGIIISDFCAYASNGEQCAVAHGGGLSTLDIVFARPNPTTSISTNGVYSSLWQSACLTISLPVGSSQYVSRYLSISYSGDINANASSCL